jgi:hypothetical protein
LNSGTSRSWTTSRSDSTTFLAALAIPHHMHSRGGAVLKHTLAELTGLSRCSFPKGFEVGAKSFDRLPERPKLSCDILRGHPLRRAERAPAGRPVSRLHPLQQEEPKHKE